ncbi:hypothetical protein L332_13055 [Agrococcus pavilionensis RW1]|uniref:Uncharacterized protein n=1 Tax=Agrococcus pavilionensis RW1 TaxID=1330458 RepID=U1LTA7_9MICO|nr:hypothetical protein [Agrococcus pavilionensis]ERG65362.1 hypothetical protein L332_13055 [Agrococcus pavilionensis RW1]
MQEPTATTQGWPHDRDPQSFTRGDIMAWRVVGYCAAAVTVVGTTAAVIAFVVLANA